VATHNESLITRFQHPVLHLDKGELTVRQKLRAAAP
jgi:ABC-type ATPase involved in cell division